MLGVRDRQGGGPGISPSSRRPGGAGPHTVRMYVREGRASSLWWAPPRPRAWTRLGAQWGAQVRAEQGDCTGGGVRGCRGEARKQGERWVPSPEHPVLRPGLPLLPGGAPPPWAGPRAPGRTGHPNERLQRRLSRPPRSQVALGPDVYRDHRFLSPSSSARPGPRVATPTPQTPAHRGRWQSRKRASQPVCTTGPRGPGCALQRAGNRAGL